MLALLALQDVDALLRSLEDEDLAVRERAAATLIDRWEAWTEADLAKLRKASGGANAEAAVRAGEALRRIRFRKQVGASAFRHLPKAESILQTGAAVEKKELLYEAHRLWRLGELDSPGARALAEAVGEAGWGLVGEAAVGQDRIIRPFIPVFRTGLKDPKRREEAVDVLASLDARELSDELAPMLNDADPAVRLSAADALFDWGVPVDPARVADLLKGTPQTVREHALRVLTKMRASSQAEAVAPLLADPDESIRKGALRALGAMGARDRAPAVVALLRDESASVRGDALGILGAWGSREHSDAVLARLADPVAGVQTDAADAVRKLGAAGLAKQLLPFVTHPDHKARWNAWELLDEAGQDLVATLRTTLKHEAPEVRETAVRFLGRRRKKEDGPVLEALLKDLSAGVRREALRALGDRVFSDRAAAVAALLDDSDPATRGFAACALARMGDVSRADRVARLLEGTDRWEVQLAARALGWMGARKHAKPIAALLRKGPRQGLETLVMALADMGAREEADAVADALQKPDFLLSTAVLEALWRFGSDRLDGVLTLVLEADEEWGKDAALKILGKRGGAEAVRKIEPYLEGPVRGTAMASLLASGRPEAFEKALGLLADPEFECRAAAAWWLAGWTASGAAPPDRARLERMLDRLDEDRDEEARAAAVVARVGLKLREPAAIRPVLERYDWAQIDLVLASLAAGEAFLKLRHRFEVKEEIRSVEQLRLALEVPLEIDGDLVLLGCVREGTRATGLELLDRLVRRDDPERALASRVGFAVEGGVLKVLPGDRAIGAWRRTIGVR